MDETPEVSSPAGAAALAHTPPPNRQCSTRASLQGYSRGAFQERLQQFGRRDEEETAAAAAAAGGDRRTPPRSKHTVQEFSFKTSAFFGSKINVHASIPRLVTEDYVRGKFPKGLPRSAEPAAPAPQPQLPLPGRLDVTPPRGAAPSPPPASPGRLDGSSAIASAPPAKRRAASGRLEAQPLAAELSAEPRPLLGRLVRPPAPAAECWEAPARGQTAAAVEHASSTARSRISIAAPAREALPATPAAVPQLSSEAGATAEPAEAGTAVVRPAAPACGHEAHLASEQVVPVANRAAAAAAAAAVAPRRSRVNAGCQAARESGWRAGSGQATAADVPAPPAPAAAVAESHLDLATLLAAWPSPAGGADVGPAQGAGGSLRRTFAPSPRRPAARPPAVPLLGCGAAQEAGEALPFGEVSNLVSPAAEAPGSFQVAQLKAASTGGSRRSGGGSTRSGGRSGGGKRGSSDSGASDSSGRGGSEAGASLPPRPRHASASQIRPQALSAAAPDISSRSCSSSSMPLPCDLPPRPSSRGTQPIPLATAPTGEQNDGSAGSVKQQPQQPAQAPFAPQPVGQAPADAPGGSQPAHSDSLAQPATPRRPLAKPLAARTPRSGTPSVHSSHRPRPAVSAAALAAVVQLPEMPAAAAGSSVQPFDTKPAASGGFGPPPPPQQHSSPRKIPSPQKRVRPPVAPRPRPSSYAVIAQHRPEPVAAASAGLPPPRQPPQQEAPAAATDGARPPAGPLEVDSTHHRRPQAGLAEPMAPGLSHMPAACSSDAGSASPRSDASAASSERQRPQPDAAPAAATGYAAKAAAKAAARAAAEAAAQQRRQAAIAARKVAAAAAAAEAERAAADAEALLAPAPEEMSYDLAAGTAAETAAAEPCEPRFSSALGAGTSQPLPKGHYSAVQLLATCGSDAMVAAAAAAASQPVVGVITQVYTPPRSVGRPSAGSIPDSPAGGSPAAGGTLRCASEPPSRLVADLRKQFASPAQQPSAPVSPARSVGAGGAGRNGDDGAAGAAAASGTVNAAESGAEEVGSSGGAGAPDWMPNPRLNPFMPAVHESWEKDGNGGAAGGRDAASTGAPATLAADTVVGGPLGAGAATLFSELDLKMESPNLSQRSPLTLPEAAAAVSSRRPPHLDDSSDPGIGLRTQLADARRERLASEVVARPRPVKKNARDEGEEYVPPRGCLACLCCMPKRR